MATTPKPISQAKLKKMIVSVINRKAVRIDEVTQQNHFRQVPDPIMVREEPNGKFSILIELTDLKAEKKFFKQF